MDRIEFNRWMVRFGGGCRNEREVGGEENGCKKTDRERHTTGEITTGGVGFGGTTAVIVVGLYAGLLVISRDSRRTCLDLHRHAPGQTRCVPLVIFFLCHS